MRLVRTWMVLALLLMVVGCELITGTTSTPASISELKLGEFQNALTEPVWEDEEGNTVSVALISVVDTSSMEEQAEESDEDTEQRNEAARRERLVAQEIGNKLTHNKLITVVSPSKEQKLRAREEIIAQGSAALSSELAVELSKELTVDYLVMALIDREGAQVDIVAQESTGGSHVYQDKIEDWPVLIEGDAENANAV